MSTSVYVTIKTKPEYFDDLYQYSREDLWFTREYSGCNSIHCSSNKTQSTLRFCSEWENEAAFMAYFAARQNRSEWQFSEWIADNGVVIECFTTEDWGYGRDYNAQEKSH